MLLNSDIEAATQSAYAVIKQCYDEAFWDCRELSKSSVWNQIENNQEGDKK